MKPIKKYIIIFVGLLIFLSLGYIGIQKSNTPISQSDIDVTATKSIIPKPSPALSGSETVWGNNPFQTGDTHTGEAQKPAIQKVVFQKPNTEWKTRTLSGITYVFGEGNPKEVALDEFGIQKLATDCMDMPHSVDIPPSNLRAIMLWENDYCDAETSRPRYLSRQVEFHLLMALSHPNWQELYTKCEENFRFVDSHHVGIIGSSLTFDQVFFSGTLDINNFILIDQKTGWKKLNTALVSQLTRFIENAQLIGGRGEVDENPYGNCVDIHGGVILNHLQQAIYHYKVPL